MSTPYDLLITGGQVVTGNGVFAADVAVRNGKVAAILSPGEPAEARERIDASGKHLFPGVVDTHVHLRDPGRIEREDFTTGTRAAAAGGVTMILEMPISIPTVNSGEILTLRAATVQPKAVVDFALYGAAGQGNIDAIAGQAEAGAVAFKTFLHEPMPGREHEFVGLWCTDYGILHDVMIEVGKTGLRHCFHCENDPMLQRLEKEFIAAGKGYGLAHAESRPEVVEDTSVAELLALAANVGGQVQICHMSSPLSAQLVQEAKARGVNVTAETCPQYLFLTHKALEEHGPFAKCNPALRSAGTVERFWTYVQNGTIDVVGSDHSPYIVEEKERGLEDIFKAPAGMPGLEVMLPSMLTAVNQGRLDLPAAARLLAENAARIFNLPQKGRIAVGCDADIVLINLDEEWTFDRKKCFTKAWECMRAYDGMKLQGKVVRTILRGTTVFDGSEVVGTQGYGQFVRPPAR